jgi:hypothetical protein
MTTNRKQRRAEAAMAKQLGITPNKVLQVINRQK